MGRPDAQADLTMEDLRDHGDEIKFRYIECLIFHPVLIVRFLKKIDLFGSIITEYEDSKFPNLFALSFKVYHTFTFL
jgi:hypothetical protein